MKIFWRSSLLYGICSAHKNLGNSKGCLTLRNERKKERIEDELNKY